MTRHRPFLLSDGLVLVAATAAGFAATRDLFHVRRVECSVSMNVYLSPNIINQQSVTFPSYWAWAPQPRGWIDHANVWLDRVAHWPTPCLTAWTLALLALSLRHPRPSLRILTRRPGFMAGEFFFGGLIASALLYPNTLVNRTGGGPALNWSWPFWSALAWFSLPWTAGFAVALSWLTLAMSGRWSADRGWLDRAGRAFGACWIVTGLACLLIPWLTVFR